MSQNAHGRTRSRRRRACGSCKKAEIKLPPMGQGDLTLEHTANWFECIRSRQQPHCTVDNGFAHSMACMMSTEAYWSGEKQYWDAAEEVIQNRPVER